MELIRWQSQETLYKFLHRHVSSYTLKKKMVQNINTKRNTQKEVQNFL